jgi:hypothetical protein
MGVSLSHPVKRMSRPSGSQAGLDSLIYFVTTAYTNGGQAPFPPLLISMPPDELKKVATYQAAFYESEKKI